MWLRNNFRVMQEAAGDGGGGGGGDASTAAPGAGDSTAAAVDATATTTDTTGAPSGAQPAGSLLKTGADAPAPTPSEYIPEKFHVKNDAGEFDVEASARKMAESYSHLEKRAGTGEGAPKSADEYTFTPPEALKDLDLKADPDMKGFLERAHKVGLNQQQMDVVMGEYFRLAPQLAQGAAMLDQEQGAAELKKVWATESDFKRNTNLAFTAASAAAERAGVSLEDVERAGLGNNPTFLRLMAALGPEFQEDKQPGGATFKTFGADDVRALEMSEAYRNPKHPDHDKVSKQVKGWYDRTYGSEAAA